MSSIAEAPSGSNAERIGEQSIQGASGARQDSERRASLRSNGGQPLASTAICTPNAEIQSS